MSYPINYPTPTNCDVQIFHASVLSQTWYKPQGISFVFFLLIGAGAAGIALNNTGGPAGSVTACLIPAFLVPDNLVISVGFGGTVGASGTSTLVRYRNSSGIYTLLTASGGSGLGNPASSSTAFSAAGFFRSVAGVPGVGGNVNASSLSFLSGGTASGTSTVTGNYGYSIPAENDGLFLMGPPLVGLGAATAGSVLKGGIGCGGGRSSPGGNGMAVIVSW